MAGIEVTLYGRIWVTPKIRLVFAYPVSMFQGSSAHLYDSVIQCREVDFDIPGPSPSESILEHVC